MNIKNFLQKNQQIPDPYKLTDSMIKPALDTMDMIEPGTYPAIHKMDPEIQF